MPCIGSPAPATGTPAHTVYPYMLRDLTFTRSNHVWVADFCLRAVQKALTRYGCWLDYVLVESLWKRIKYDEVYLHACRIVSAIQQGLERYFLEPAEAIGAFAG